MKKTPLIHIFVIFAFLINTFGPFPEAQAQLVTPLGGEFELPAPGVMVHLSPEFNPPMLKGIKVHPENPFRFEFILDRGDSPLKSKSSPNKNNMSSPNALIGDPQQEQLKTESTKLIKYFLSQFNHTRKRLLGKLKPI